MRCFFRALIFVVPIFSQSVFAAVTVHYKIYVTGTAKSSVNQVGFSGYKFEGSVPATAPFNGTNKVSTTTDTSGNYNPNNFFAYGTQSVTPVSVSGQLKVKFTVPYTLNLKRTSADTTFLTGGGPVDILIEKNITSSTTVVDISVSKQVNVTFLPPKPPEVGLFVMPSAAGVTASILLPDGLTGDEWDRATFMIGTGATAPAAGCPDGANLQKVRIPTSIFDYVEPPGALHYKLKAGGYGNVNHNIRVCLVSKYSRGSDGAVATLLPGPSTVQAIRNIGLAPLGVSSQYFRVSSSGYSYNHNGGREKWLVRGAGTGANTLWSYILPSGIVRSPVQGFSPTTDPLVANFNAFTSGSSIYQYAAYVYDHPTLLTQNPAESVANLQLENLDSDYRFSAPANGNYFFNALGLNEKRINGDNLQETYGGWIIEPNGLMSQCLATGSGEICIPSQLVPIAVYDTPTILTRAHEYFLESKYLFVRGPGTTDQLNWAGLGEKWYKSTTTNLWYYILPNGNVYRWDSSSMAGTQSGLDTFVFTTSPSVYSNSLADLVNLIP